MTYQTICDTIVVCTTKNGYIFLIDYDDLSKVSMYSWEKSNDYLLAWDSKLHKPIYLHQLIMGSHIDRKEGYVVDHINRQKADNRKKKLRIVTYQENSRNRSLSSCNTSGVTGVSFNKKYEKWQATIRIDGKLIMLGMKKDMDEAIQLRKNAETTYFQ